MIFPGMDPYLEDSQLWLGLHSRLVVYMADQLQPLLGPRYIAGIEERVFLEVPGSIRIPDILVKKKPAKRKKGGIAVLEADTPLVVHAPAVEIHEPYITLLDTRSGMRVVTVIELISPTNKYDGPGRVSYLNKQKEILQSDAHLVEIDLLRHGNHLAAVPEWLAREQGPYDYLACVNRARGERNEFDLYPRRLADRLPRVRVPLVEPDPDVALDLQAFLEHAYETGRYRERIAYDRPCVPALPEQEKAWANQLIRKAEAGRKKKNKQ